MTILKEGAAKFHSYASGRRFCTGVVVMLDLRPRMELFQGHVLNAILPQDDILDLEVKFLLCPRTSCWDAFIASGFISSMGPVQLSGKLRQKSREPVRAEEAVRMLRD